MDGRAVVQFSSGEVRLPPFGHVLDAARRVMDEPWAHRYSPPAGLAELRSAVAATALRDGRWRVGPERVLITPGARMALFLALRALVDGGDEVLVPRPYWSSYPDLVRLAGGEPVPVGTGGVVRMSAGLLDRAATARTRGLLFNSPTNPSGLVYRAEEVAAIGAWVRDRNLWVICDDLYAAFLFTGGPRRSMPVVVPELGDRCVVIDGISKTYAMTGWRVGWLIGPERVVAPAERMQTHLAANVSNLAQVAATAALTHGTAEVRRRVSALDAQRVAMSERLDRLRGFACPRPEGGLFCFPDVSGALRRWAGQGVASSTDLAGLIGDRAAVTVSPGDSFGAPSHLRLCFATAPDELEEGLRRLEALFGCD